MNGYHFDLSCPRCGGKLAHAADGRPQAGTRAMALCECTECRKSYTVETVVRCTERRGAPV